MTLNLSLVIYSKFLENVLVTYFYNKIDENELQTNYKINKKVHYNNSY